MSGIGSHRYPVAAVFNVPPVISVSFATDPPHTDTTFQSQIEAGVLLLKLAGGGGVNAGVRAWGSVCVCVCVCVCGKTGWGELRPLLPEEEEGWGRRKHSKPPPNDPPHRHTCLTLLVRQVNEGGNRILASEGQRNTN